MDINPTFFLGILVAAIGFSVLRANPRRKANQAFSVVSLIGVLWCALVAFQHESVDPRPGMRANAIASLFVPWGIVLLHFAIAYPKHNHKQLLLQSVPWFLGACMTLPLCLLESFIGPIDATGRFRRGMAYGLHCGVLGMMYISIIALASRQLRHLSGIRRLEIQFVVISLGIGCVLCLVFLTVGNFLDNVVIKYIGIFVVLLTCAIIGWSIGIRRIYNIQQTYIAILRYSLLIISFALITSVIFRGLTYAVPPHESLMLAASFGGGLVMLLEHYTRRRTEHRKASDLAEIRLSVIEEAKSEASTARLVSRFSEVLKEQFHTRDAMLLLPTGQKYEAASISLSKSREAFGAICSIGATTPETLQRRPADTSTTDLARFFSAYSLGLAMAVPRGSPAPSFILVLGVKTNEWPFTYPEIEQMQNVAELMDSILAHSRLTAQAALRARMEHLALMSRGLAHDLKNLITPISTFLLHTEGCFPANSPAGEVHAQARRSMRVITDYVSEALFFSTRKEPCFEQISIAELCHETVELMVARATPREIKFLALCSSDAVIAADKALLHRMLINLVTNALEASSPGSTVSVTAVELEGERVRFQIADEGMGIAPEHINRVFEPYFTTKNFGDNLRGWGLGLAICQSIVLLHDGHISVESRPGKGTTFTVDLPMRRRRDAVTEAPSP